MGRAIRVMVVDDTDHVRQMLASMKFSIMHEIPGIGLEARWGTILALFKWVYAAVSPLGAAGGV